MTFDLSNEFQRKAFLARCEDCLEKAVAVELSVKTFRSRNQNRYIHLLLGVVAMDTGNSVEYVKEMYFKRLVNSDLFVLDREDKLLGKVQVLRSSADLTTEEMSMAIDRFKRWGAENGFYMPEPGDESILRQIEIEMGRQRNFIGG